MSDKNTMQEIIENNRKTRELMEYLKKQPKPQRPRNDQEAQEYQRQTNRTFDAIDNSIDSLTRLKEQLECQAKLEELYNDAENGKPEEPAH